MVMQRQGLFFIIVGTNGTGKTTLLRNLLEGLNRKKTLIVEPDGYEWRDVKEIDYSEIPTMSDKSAKGLAPDEQQIEELIYFQNGNLVLDDCRYYAGKRLQNAIRKVLIRRRQNSVDIFAVAHGTSEIPPDFYTFATHLILFKTNDSLQRLRGTMDRDRIEKIGYIRNEINQHPSHHHYKIISLRDL